MKTIPFVDGVTIFLVTVAGLSSTCNGHPRLRDHQRTDIRIRLLEKAFASPSNSFVQTVGSLSVLPALSETDPESDLLDTLHNEKQLTPFELELHVNEKGPDFQRAMADFATGRRLQSQPTGTSGEHGKATYVAPESSPTGIRWTKPSSTSANIPNASSAGRSAQPIDVKDMWRRYQSRKTAPQQHSVHDILEFDLQPKLIMPRQDDEYQSFVLAGFSTSTTPAATSTAAASLVCPDNNGTTYVSAAGIQYQVTCNVDYLDNDYPFESVDSFTGCVQKCDAYNYNHHNVQCSAALFVPGRERNANDCYLKSSIQNPVAAALPIQGAIRLGYATTAASSTASTSLALATLLGNSHGNSPSTTSSFSMMQSISSSSSTASPSLQSVFSAPGITYASGSSIVTPIVAQSHLHGPTRNTPSKQYLKIESPPSIKLASNILTIGVNSDITTGYGLSAETGALEINSSTQSYLVPLTNTPHLSRDGGKGGMLNGEHLFIFCDTGSYSTTTATTNGNFLGFVSSSVAVDVGLNALNGDTLDLQDGIGQWSDDVGRMRGFAPLTEGEVAYNLAMQGQGQRYAVWPESSIIPLDSTTGLIYAPIVYDNVNEETRAAVFTYTGSTLLTITAGGKGGPIAQRPVDKIFDQDEVEWGCIGGIRSWGSSGVGAADGLVYLFGNVAGGMLLARVAPVNVSDKNSYEYWDGNTWTTTMQRSSSNAYFIEGSFMDADVFYSPRHLTFIIVYMTVYADSTFYYRYLDADVAILPPFAPGGSSSSDYVENVLKFSWSDQEILYKASPGLSGKYVYSGGVHLGYYGSDDILNGGSKMLLGWTAPTGSDPSTLTSEYQIPTAEIDWL